MAGDTPFIALSTNLLVNARDIRAQPTDMADHGSKKEKENVMAWSWMVWLPSELVKLLDTSLTVLG